MEGLADKQRMDTLEKKMDEGFARVDRGFAEMRAQIQSSERALRGEIAEVRSDARSDFRTLIGVVVAMWVATMLAVAGHLPIHL